MRSEKRSDEIVWILGSGLVSDCIHDAEHILGAMIDFAHEEINLLLALLAFGNVLSGADEAREPSLTPGALEISKPMSLHPADLAVSPLNPVPMRVRLPIGGEQPRPPWPPNRLPLRSVPPLHSI